MNKKELHEGKRASGVGGGGCHLDQPPIFNSIRPIDMKLGICNKCPVYFQLSIVTWYFISFHRNRSIYRNYISKCKNRVLQRYASNRYKIGIKTLHL